VQTAAVTIAVTIAIANAVSASRGGQNFRNALPFKPSQGASTLGTPIYY
jgi:hypothetical protein